MRWFRDPPPTASPPAGPIAIPSTRRVFHACSSARDDVDTESAQTRAPAVASMDSVVTVTLTRSRALVLALVLLALLVVAGRRLAGAGAASSQPAAAGRLEPIAAAPA